jgi:hypothetical protein
MRELWYLYFDARKLPYCRGWKPVPVVAITAKRVTVEYGGDRYQVDRVALEAEGRVFHARLHRWLFKAPQQLGVSSWGGEATRPATDGPPRQP